MQSEHERPKENSKKVVNIEESISSLINTSDSLLDRVATIEVTLVALSRLLINAKICSEEDIDNEVIKERERLEIYKQIQSLKGNYRVRSKLCKENKIDINDTNIVTQLREDVSLTEKEKIEIASEYGIDVRIFIKQ
jgi:hypothetical protein